MKYGLIKLAVLPILLVAGFFSIVKIVKAQDIMISQDTVWPSDQIIIINGQTGVSIESGITLTIKAGAIVKMAENNGFEVRGNLIVEGKPNNPVIITSLKDDSAGGDSNGGDNTLPAPGDWSGLVVGSQDANIRIDYAEIKYGGSQFLLLINNANELIINHSRIVNNSGYILINSFNNFQINFSNLYNPDFCQSEDPLGQPNTFCGGAMLYNLSASPIDATNNYWGHADGPTVNPPPVNGTVIAGNVTYQPYLISPWQPEPVPTEPDPVIIVPGIMGSWNVRGVWRIDPIFNTYDNLIEALIAAGYNEDTILQDKPTLFTFPYDWRLSNSYTALLLKNKIAEVKQRTGKNKVDLVCHSMGGLIARAYIQSDNYQYDIDQVIFLGTPHQGSLESYLKYGGAFFRGKYGGIQKFYFQIEALAHGYINLVDYIHLEVPTVEQLLPIFSYLKDKQADSSWQIRTYPYNYPRNIFLENFNSEANLVLLKQRSDITNIVSNLGATSTLEFIKVVSDPNPNDNLWQNGYPENLDNNFDSLEGGSGDGTVPYKSANSLVNIKVIETVNNDHNSLPTTMQEEIIETLTGKKPTDYFSNVITATIKRWSFFRVYSPVDFVVIAPDGKKVGKDFTANTEINEIADAFYSGFDNNTEFVLIPNPQDGQYKVQLQAVGQGGDYTLATSFIDDDKPQNTQELQIKSTILAGTTDNFSINFKEDNPAETTIKSEVDFNKLIDLTNLLYQAGEIKKTLVKNLLITQFGYLSKQYDKMIGSSNNKQKQLLKTAIILELKLINKTLTLYEIAHFITAKARNILSTNINLLIEKLSI